MTTTEKPNDINIHIINIKSIRKTKRTRKIRRNTKTIIDRDQGLVLNQEKKSIQATYSTKAPIMTPNKEEISIRKNMNKSVKRKMKNGKRKERKI